MNSKKMIEMVEKGEMTEEQFNKILNNKKEHKEQKKQDALKGMKRNYSLQE